MRIPGQKSQVWQVWVKKGSWVQDPGQVRIQVWIQGLAKCGQMGPNLRFSRIWANMDLRMRIIGNHRIYRFGRFGSNRVKYEQMWSNMSNIAIFGGENS